MACLHMELHRPGAKSRYHFMMLVEAHHTNVAKRFIANTMHLRFPSSEWEGCPQWVKNDCASAPIVLIRAQHGQGDEQALSARASHFGGTLSCLSRYSDCFTLP
eukprot:8487931-Lingulodinium_polyedra.AAC.1